MNEVLKYAQEIFSSILLALLSLAGAMIIYYINKAKAKLIAETNKIKQDNVKDYVSMAIETIDKIVKTAVYSAEQETASEIRKKIANGDTSVSREDLLSVKTQVYNTVVETVKPDLINAAKITLGDVDKYILDKISEEVKNLKDSQNVSEGS